MYSQTTNLLKVSISVLMTTDKKLYNQQAGLTAQPWCLVYLNIFVYVCLNSSFITSLLIKYKGPAALLCLVRYCWGVIWLHSVPLPSKAAELYLQIRQCLAKPLYWLAFYLKEKADLDPVALYLPVSLSFRLSVFVSCTRFSMRLFVCLSLPPFSFSLVCLYLSPVICFPHPSLRILHPVLCLFLSLSLCTHTHTPHYSSISPTHLLS